MCIVSSVTSIEDSAFSDCTGLTSITIPNGVTSIGASAFSGCSSLASITVPFVGGSPTKNTFLGYLFGARYYNNNASYVPSALKSVTVTNVLSISANAFYGCSSLQSITFPSNVTSIGASAFYGCTGLASVTIPESVTSIGSSAFYGCTGLGGVYISDIAKWCAILFDGNNSNPLAYGKKLYLNGELVTALTIPDGVTDIGDVFAGCTSLTSLTIPDGVASIGDSAFDNCTGLTSVTIGSGVASIGDSAFDNCTALTSVTIGSGVTSIGYSAFSGCTGLGGVYISDIAKWCAISFDNYDSNPLRYAHRLYLNGELVTALTIPDGVTSIGKYAFYECADLMSVTVGRDVTSIGDGAFYNCYKLVEVINKSSSLTLAAGESDNGYIAYYAREIRADGESRIVNYNNSGYLFCTLDGVHYLLGYTGSDKNLMLPEKYNGETYEVYRYAFYGCRDIVSVTIGKSVTGIGSSAFSGCTGLASITVPFVGGSPTANTFLGYIFGASSYSSNDSYVPESLKSVIVTSAISIDGYAFYDCTNLTSVTIPDGVTSIGASAFSGCSSLTSITVPFVGGSPTANTFLGYIFGASSYSSNASYVPRTLKSVTVTSALSIDEYAFYGCTSLKSITLPAYMSRIGASAFSGCTSLESMTLPFAGGSSYAFSGDAFLGYIFGASSYNDNADYVPQSLKSITVTGEVLTGNYAFYKCESLTSVTFVESVQLGSYAFAYCTSLESVTFPDTYVRIGDYAFAYCTSLKSITLPSNVQMGNNAFYMCDCVISYKKK